MKRFIPGVIALAVLAISVVPALAQFTSPSGGGGVTSVAGRSGVVTLGVADVAGAAPAASPAFTGGINVTGTTVLNTALPVASGGTGAATAPLALTALGAAPTASPAFTGGATVVGGLTTDTAKVAVSTVAALGVCNASLEGTHRAVSDATAPTFLATLAGAGTVHSPAFCNGTNWVAG